ncbi:MAG: phenylalanine--tRNA ligase beta subunit-related protein [Candidatus Nanopelagicales bacterium]|nr:phenylalanine--tRNA ligase beta subunit-related protein [Candidatus Nanopelagicales bacterium]
MSINGEVPNSDGVDGIIRPMLSNEPQASLDSAHVDDSIFVLRPDYRAMVISAIGVCGGPSDEFSNAALERAEEKVRARLGGEVPEALPEIAAWREAFLGFGVKPRQGRSSVEALIRRIDAGLPRIDRLTDLYNAISVEHLIPIGGENLDRYVGAARLVRANGDEIFDTVVDGESADTTPYPGEVIWRDDIGVTCRRWNWRQCMRTRLSQETTNVVFILDALEPVSDEALNAAADALITLICVDSPDLRISHKVLGLGKSLKSAPA